jgi:hypothetical protein
MILHNQDLAIELKKAFDKAQRRIWIAVPFIGSWDLVEKIIGNHWISKRNIDVRLITDIRNEFFISPDTFDVFKQCATIKTLPGLHAKVYIIDDFQLVTSANLTGTAFSKRYEIGLTLTNDKEVDNIFDEWWSKATNIDKDWKPQIKEQKDTDEPEDSIIEGLKILWKLPKSLNKKGSTEYALYVNIYNSFVNLYEKHCKRLIPDISINQEVDAFFNYLFHEHDETPSNEYLEKQHRDLTEKERITELIKYFGQFKNWLGKNPQFENYRKESIKIIQQKLSVKLVDTLNWDDIKNILNRLHCMNSLPINKAKILNPLNNDLETIKNEWKNLIHNKSIPLETRMKSCNDNLYGFGKSGIRELIAWYYPDEYPVMNRNSNSGMKFFGYDIKTY